MKEEEKAKILEKIDEAKHLIQEAKDAIKDAKAELKALLKNAFKGFEKWANKGKK